MKTEMGKNAADWLNKKQHSEQELHEKILEVQKIDGDEAGKKEALNLLKIARMKLLINM